MTNDIKLYEGDFAPGFMQADPDEPDTDLNPRWTVCGPLPRKGDWRQFSATWWHRSGRRMRVPTVSRYLTSVCIRSDVVSTIGLDAMAKIEALPFTVEGEAWSLLRPVHRLRGTDLATSVPVNAPDHHNPGHSRLVRYEWINAVDPDAEQATIFDTRPEGGVTWVTEEFVRRVRAAGLEGLRFVHKGYLVRDLSQARPRPAPKPRALPEAKRPDTALVTEMDAEFLAQRDHARASADPALPAAATATAEACLELLDDWFEQGHRIWAALDEEQRDLRVEVAVAVFGDLVCRDLGWRWVTLRRGDETPCLAVATADGACAVPLHRFARRQFVLKERTPRLLFNMLRVGQLPAAPTQGAALIG